MKKKIAVFTVARSDFGIMKNIIHRIDNDDRFELTCVIGAAHDSKVFGQTINEIKEMKIKRIKKFKFNYVNSDSKNIMNYFQMMIDKTCKFFDINKIDAALILGDRYEMMAIALTCINYNIPIMHFCGGSETLGSIDDIYRYSISKMAFAHFLETNHHKKNLNKLNIKKNLYIVGAPALENLKTKTLSISEIEKYYQFSFNKDKKIVVACFHPETYKTTIQNRNYLRIFLNFLKKQNINLIFTYPNADKGFMQFIKLIKSKLKNKKNCLIVKNLGIKNYYSILNFSDLMIGNSSSGIIESASFNIPTINLYNRQKNRYCPKNVIHSIFNLEKINYAYKKALSLKFKNKIINLKNPYFQKDTSIKVANIIFKLLNKRV
jgi:GDP/UDP-N,N'-diacetylbacillosamine 2-epimerase (hydrolysing)